MGGINFDSDLKKNHEMEGASLTPRYGSGGCYTSCVRINLHCLFMVFCTICTILYYLYNFVLFVLFCSILYYFVLSIIFLQWDQGKAFYTLNCFCEPQCNAGSKEIQSLFDINVILIHIDI